MCSSLLVLLLFPVRHLMEMHLDFDEETKRIFIWKAGFHMHSLVKQWFRRYSKLTGLLSLSQCINTEQESINQQKYAHLCYGKWCYVSFR